MPIAWADAGCHGEDMSANDDFEQWRRERRAYVTGPVGNIALIGFQPVYDEPAALDGDWPGTTWRTDGDEGVSLDITGPGVRLDGVEVSGPTFLGRLQADGTPHLTYGSQTLDAFSLDGTDYELRRYDADAPGLAQFVEIDAYPYDPDLRLTGTMLAYGADADRRVPWDYTRASDAGHLKEVPGLVAVTIAGVEHRLLAFVDNGGLVLTFSDATTGAESYAPGRFLKFPMPSEDGSVEVDFNRTIIPPCGFSAYYSCPLPPPENRLSVPIRGGERRVRWLHGDH